MRFHYLDALRGLSVLAMIIFHGAYDLKFFNFLDWNFNQGFWYAFPRVIAFSFLFCVGLSLSYAHTPRVNWQKILKRSVKLLVVAFFISLGTYLTFPEQWIYFGTIHCILLGTLLEALLVNRRKLSLILLIIILVLQYIYNFDIKWVFRLIGRPSLDFIPIYPWFWAILLGINLAPYLSRNSHLQKVKSTTLLDFFGKHSLKIYLIHQPLFFGILWGIKELSRR